MPPEQYLAQLSSLPPYWRTYMSLRQAVQSGQFPPGSRMPSQVDLAKRCGVSLETTRKAIALLENEGYVVTRHGSGTYVSAQPPSDEPAVTLPDVVALSARSFSSEEEAMGHVLDLLLSRLPMASVFVSRIDQAAGTFEIVGERGMPSGYGVGYRCQLDSTYCGRAIATSSPTVVSDSRAQPQFARLPVTRSMNIGAYIGVPLRLSDGRLFGTLCALDSRARDLRTREADFLRALGRMLAWQLEQAELRRALAAGTSFIRREAADLLATTVPNDDLAKRLERLAARASELEQMTCRLTESSPE